MFEALISSGLSGFLGCSSAIFETALVEFFHNASVRDGVVVSTIQGKPVAISEELFANTFVLPLEGLSGLHEVPQDLVLEARRAFSYDGKLVSTSCEKRKLVFEFRLLNDILAKSVMVKAGSFDAVTHERFLMMTAIYGDVPVNWSKILFKVLKDMVTPGSKQARGFAVQIFIVLKGNPDLELGESNEFPPLKILTANTVGKYIAINKNIVVEDVEDEPVMEKQAEKKNVVSKKIPAPTVESPVVKRKRTSGRTTPVATDLTLVTVAQEVVPIQMISAVTPPAPKHKAPKRRLQLPAGSDDDIVEKEPDVVDVGEQQREKSTTDDVDKIIEMVLTEIEQMETDMGESDMVTECTDMDTETVLAGIEHSSAVNDEDDNLDGAENEIARKMASSTAPKQFLKEPLRSGEDDDISGVEQPSKTTDEDSMSIEDLLKQIPDDAMMPSVTAEGPTRIKFGLGIQIPGVSEVDPYTASLPQIAATDKGKEPVVVDTIQGHPAREIFSLICIDIDFLVQLREQVIEDITKFINSFSLRRLVALGSTEDIATKEERVLSWAETDSVLIALQRRVLIISKYRELLLRKFIEARRHNFISGTRTTAIDLKVLKLLTAAHHFSLKVLLRQMKKHKLEWTRPSSSYLFEGDHIDRGLFIPRNHKTIFSTCWIRAMIFDGWVDSSDDFGVWVMADHREGVDYWRPITRPVDSRTWELLPQRPYIDELAPLCALLNLSKTLILGHLFPGLFVIFGLRFA
ncbi:splicing factor 3B subunit 1-like [Dorcoceras hygrometricum]|uniref:Splicing factor 3B subunit 1-like n=1 Tax=Dorcoceras hygrometricum TaxID=472368 RepID=A0A2Z7BHU8_9LAMI|nr:splicing factor 3B subunit 1-like [Dorcoceras hygrometricum]